MLMCVQEMLPAGADQVIAFHHIVRNENLALQLVGGDASKLSGFDNGNGGVGGYARILAECLHEICY